MLVARRYERASLIVASNKPFSASSEIFGDDATAAAMIDRVVHHAAILSLKATAMDTGPPLRWDSLWMCRWRVAPARAHGSTPEPRARNLCERPRETRRDHGASTSAREASTLNWRRGSAAHRRRHRCRRPFIPPAAHLRSRTFLGAMGWALYTTSSRRWTSGAGWASLRTHASSEVPRTQAPRSCGSPRIPLVPTTAPASQALAPHHRGDRCRAACRP